MISSLHGRLEAIGNGWAIINVHGIGFQVYIPTSALSTLAINDGEIHLYTYLHISQDNVTLFGFTLEEDRELFHLLLGISSIGPKTALAILSTINAEQISLAIATDNVDMLTMVPGIGKKTASRIVLELKDKLGGGVLMSPLTQVAQENTDVITALTSLGYSAGEATRAVATLLDDKKLKLEDKIKLALQYFDQK